MGMSSNYLVSLLVGWHSDFLLQCLFVSYLAYFSRLVCQFIIFFAHITRYKGVLLYGPPGTGKTSLACTCAKIVDAQLFTINGPEIISQYYGESEQALHDVFTSAKKAAPSVVKPILLVLLFFFVFFSLFCYSYFF